MRVSLRAVLITLVALVAIGSLITTLPAGTSNASSWHEGECANEAGVTLVVDFGESSKREPLVRCAKEFKGTGWDAFAATEVAVEGTAEYQTGFVCRVDGLPTKAEQPCTSTPTYEQGGWSYFFATADTGSNWMFSGTGSQMRTPKCGSVEGWRFIEANQAALDGESNLVPRVIANPYRCK